MFLVGIGGLGAPELMIILAIVVVLFGAGKLAGLGRDLGQGIKEFRKASRDPEEERKRQEEERRQEERRQEEPARSTAAATAAPPSSANGAGTPEARLSEPVTTPPPSTPARPPDFTGR